jgi:hypothetical protein
MVGSGNERMEEQNIPSVEKGPRDMTNGVTSRVTSGNWKGRNNLRKLLIFLAV